MEEEKDWYNIYQLNGGNRTMSRVNNRKSWLIYDNGKIDEISNGRSLYLQRVHTDIRDTFYGTEKEALDYVTRN